MYLTKLIRTRFTRLFGLFISCLFAFSINAAPVYKVSKGDSHIYVGGTFHILTKDDFPLQDEFYQAYKQSDSLYFETDIEGAATDPNFQSLMAAVMIYQDGTTIDKVLEPKTMNKLSDYFTGLGMPMQNLMSYTPTGLMLSITIIEYQKRGFTMAGVDQHLFEKAKVDNKSIKWFESLEEQASFLGSFDEVDADEMINYVLDSMNELDGLVSALHSTWRNGDMKGLAEVGLAEFENYPEVYDTLILKRNNSWMTSIISMFQDDNVEFVLVGALHLPGKDGLLTQLANLGYKVEKLVL